MDILGKSYLELLDLLNAKKISTKELHEYFSKRAKKYNEKINAFVTLTDDEGNDGEMPMAYKDNFNTKGIRTTASSKVLEAYIPPYDATVVERLTKTKTYVFGKTNMDAWAHGSSTETSDFGPSKNPWDTTKAPGGSSGGSAAAVSAYLSPAAIGSETAGSIRQPAAWCGVVGLKPTYGRVSRYGVIAMGSSFDCPGPITSTVVDAAYLLSKIAGKDSYDATTSEKAVPDYVNNLNKQKKYRVGVADSYFESVDNEIKEKVEAALKLIEKLGHKVTKIKLLDPKYAISAYTILQRAEVSSNLARYDGIRFGNDRTFFSEEAKRRMILGTYTLSHGYYDAYYKKAQKARALVMKDFDKAFENVDVILAPTTPTTAIKLGEFEKYPFFGELMDILNEPAAVAGLPALNIPAGKSKGNLPIGLQIMGRQFAEEDILDLGNQFETETEFFGITNEILKKYPD